MIEIIDKVMCTGCSACQQICPKNCISMEQDNEGFRYPVVDQSKCIHCGLCEKVCPTMNTSFVSKEGYPDAFLIYDKDDEWRKGSAAGGGFVALARYFVEKYNGVVFGAAYDNDFQVRHISVESVEGLKTLQKSKYVQSDLRDTFKEVLSFLKGNRYVLFSGTPCQIYGLKSYLGKLADSVYLFCIDLSCHGVPSPKVYKKYLQALEQQEKSPIASFTMRDKRLKKSAYDQGFGIVFENGNCRFVPHSQDLFGRCFWGEIASRPSCYQCHFKTVWRSADITLGDCWFLNCFVPEEQDTLGVTMALIHSHKGVQLLAENPYLKKYAAPAEKLIKANGGMIYSSAVVHPQRDNFFARLDRDSFIALVDELLPAKAVSKKHRILVIMDKFGIRMEKLRKKSRQKRLNERLMRSIPENAKGEMT